MYLMFADEADQDGQADFLVYAAVFFPALKVDEIVSGIKSIREEAGFSPTDLFKFSTGTIPKGMSREAHAIAKNKMIELASQSGCKVCCYVVPKTVSSSQPLETRLKFAVNTLLTKFDQFLGEEKASAGISFFDRTTDYNQAKYFGELCMQRIPKGMDLATPDERIPLKRVVAISQTQSTASHLNAMSDVIVGACRFVINERDKDRVGKQLIKSLITVFWTSNSGGRITATERGLIIRPQKIKSPAIQADIEELKARLNQWANN